MENLKLFLFDIFGFLLPGLLFLSAFALYISTSDPQFQSLPGISWQQLRVYIFPILVISYILGMTMHELGYIWYKYLAVYPGFYLTKAWHLARKEKDKGNESQFNLLMKSESLAKSMVLIRAFAPEQVPALAEWSYKRAMSFNMSLAFLFIGISSFMAFRTGRGESWLILSTFSILAIILLLKRAFYYDYWLKNEIKITVEHFELEKISFLDYKRCGSGGATQPAKQGEPGN